MTGDLTDINPSDKSGVIYTHVMVKQVASQENKKDPGFKK